MRSPLLLGLGPALVVALTLALPRLARADIAPPPGFVESCTMKAQSGGGKECLSCAAFYGNSDHCEMSLADYGFSQGCRTRGASVWSEVWCRPAGAGKPVPKDVLAQLDTAAGHPPVAAPPAKPTDTGPIRTEPVPTAIVAPPALPSAAPSAAPPLADPPAPPPLPPTGGCGGCATPRPETAIWAPLLALGALAVGWSRRRDRR